MAFHTEALRQNLSVDPEGPYAHILLSPAGTDRDRKGSTEIEIVGVLGKDLEIICWLTALSRRRQGFDSLWDCQEISRG
jgi:hypothetical protein